MIDFIGLGAQKSGTSWVYACLYEHPEICAPIKEIHFFSRPRFENGKAWYEKHFEKCGVKVRGEFSTSYLYSKEASTRIKELYPRAKLIAIVRNPVDRALSQYKNARKGGHIPKEFSFDEYLKSDESVVGQGRYHEQLERYYALFPKEQVLVLVYEDIKKDPRAFMQKIYAFLGVSINHEASMLFKEVNVARTPKLIFIERIMHHVSESLRKIGFDGLVHAIRKTGLPDKIRSHNTQQEKNVEVDRAMLTQFFTDDVQKLSELMSRDLVKEWNI